MRSINDSITNILEQIYSIPILVYTSIISYINVSLSSLQEQFNSLVLSPDHKSDRKSINDLISVMNQAIIELQDLILDRNDIDLTNINDSKAKL
jgi:hypothetical protein